MDTTMTADELVRQISAIPDQLGAATCFGAPVERDGHTIIPAARVTVGYGLGFGRGSGGNDSPNEHGESADQGEGEGGGGGGGGASTPVAVIHIMKDGGVEVEPIVDSTRISLAGITLAGWTIFWVTWTIRTVVRERARAKP